jgi:hypothetical protein
MPLMRDRQTGVIRDVTDKYLKRWPNDYEPLLPKDPAPTGEEQAPARVSKKTTGGRKKEES